MNRMRSLLFAPLLVLFVAACGDDAASNESAPASTSTVVATNETPTAASTTVAPGPTATAGPAREIRLRTFPVPAGSRPHDVSPAVDGRIWYTAQGTGKLGLLDPATGAVEEIDLGAGSAPHGVITATDGAAWVTAGGSNSIIRVDAATKALTRYPLPVSRNVNLNTATFDRQGRVWFTGQGGVYGVVDPRTSEVRVFDAPKGGGPYGITTTPAGEVYYASLAGSYVGKIDLETGRATVLEPRTQNQGARRVWTDSRGRIWTAEWNSGQVGLYDPVVNDWKEWRLPGSRPQAYAVYVDETDKVWLTDFGASAIVRFDPQTEQFQSFPLPDSPGNVRQLHGRPGEVWGAESANDKLLLIEF